jgi:HEAT repeat protein
VRDLSWGNRKELAMRLSSFAAVGMWLRMWSLLAGAALCLITLVGWGPSRGMAQGEEPVYRGKPLREFLQALPKGGPEGEEAGQAFRALGPKGEAAVPALILLFQGRDEVARWPVAVALSDVGPAAVPQLTRALGSPDRCIRLGVLEALGHMGPKARAAVPSLLKVVTDKDPWVRLNTVEALAAVGDRAGIPALVDRLNTDKNLTVRRYAASALRTFGPAAKEAIPALLKAIRESEQLTDTLESLTIEVESRPTISGLLASKTLADRARDSLAAMGPPGVAALTELLKDPEAGHRCAAALTLRSLGPKARAAVPQLTQALSDGDPRVRRSAAEALGAVGPAARAAVPGLAGVLKDNAVWVRSSAAEALGQIGPAAGTALPSLTDALKDRSAEVRTQAAVALDMINPRGQAGLRFLVKALKDPDQELRSAAAAGIASLGERALGAVPNLVEAALRDQVVSVRKSAVYGLLDISRPTRPEAVAAFVEALKDKDADIRRNAASALCSLTGGDAAVRALAEALRDRDHGVRAEVARALDAHGARAKEAIPDLEKALMDPDQDVRKAAGAALQTIRRQLR